METSELQATFKSISKKEWAKTAFWMPENSNHVKEEIKEPTKDLKCPFSGHKILIKKLIRVKNENHLISKVCTK